MALYTPPPPLLTTAGTTNNDSTLSQQQVHHSSSSSTSLSTSITITIIVIATAIIISASVYLFLRFLSRRSVRQSSSAEDDVLSDRRNQNDSHNHNHHVICFDSNKVDQPLPLFTFSSLTGNIAGGDCAVCLSKFEAVDQLRLLPLCCHAFHVECIDAWLKSNQTCPLCRSTVNPTEADVLNKIRSVSGTSGGESGRNGNNRLRIEIGSVSRGRTPADSGRRSYSIGSYEYVLDDGYEVSVESTRRREISNCTVRKDSDTPENLVAEIGAGGGSRPVNWLRDYVDRVSVSIYSRSQSFQGSGRFFSGNSRRRETVEDLEATHGRLGEDISELFRWFSGV